MESSNTKVFKRYHPRLGMVGAYFLALRVVDSECIVEEELHLVQRHLIEVMLNWIKSDYPDVYEGLGDTPEQTWLFDTNVWSKISPDLSDMVDAVILLRSAGYTSLRNLIDGAGEIYVFISIIFLAIESQTFLSGNAAKPLSRQCESAAHKCVTALVMLKSGPFVDISFHQEEQALLHSAAMEALANSRSEQARKGGQARAAMHHELKDYAIDQFNQSKFISMRQGSIHLAKKVVEYDKSRFGALKTKDVERRVYTWLREANKDHLLYKIF
ncbi:hypothetical protein [Marinobacterium sp. xm-a-152]|uniref:hypothetical protein n=1 Tax=Marinobacterium sp. xm-a-152 TaxID=2497733 RepID=UPI0015698A54|nr:hypothetical protein [Marinobacterium sp. xm-a-152]NRP14954.1 hypothetical protein [Marinobacterium sp. xm-a-152]